MQKTRASHNYEGSYGWGQSQPLQFGTVQEYIEAAYERRLAFKSIVEDFAKAAGPSVQVIAPCVKSEESAERKLWDRTSSSVGCPELVVDYLRARVLVPSNPGALGQLNDAMGLLIDHPLMVGYKDRIFRPNGSGFRAFNGVLNIDNLNSELQIIPDDRGGITRTINMITEGMRTSERGLREAEARLMCSADSHKCVARAEKTISTVRNLRNVLHSVAAEASGVNAMIDESLSDKFKPVSRRDVTKLYRELSKDSYARSLFWRIQDPMRLVLGSGTAMPATQSTLALH